MILKMFASVLTTVLVLFVLASVSVVLVAIVKVAREHSRKNKHKE